MLVALLATALVGCAREAARAGSGAPLRLAAVGRLPAEVQRAPTTVREAYRFALANPDLLGRIPCHCGCGSMGHTSNAACYLRPGSTSDTPLFDSHALGCSICVDITQDVMRLTREGRDVDAIRSYVETNYGRYGPSNLP